MGMICLASKAYFLWVCWLLGVMDIGKTGGAIYGCQGLCQSFETRLFPISRG
jgi:hypothetical protein